MKKTLRVKIVVMGGVASVEIKDKGVELVIDEQDAQDVKVYPAKDKI